MQLLVDPYILTDTQISFAMLVYIIPLVALDGIYTYYLLNKWRKYERNSDPLINEVNPIARFTMKKLGIFKGILFGMAIQSALLTYMVLSNPAWIASFIFGIYVMVFFSHRIELKKVSEYEGVERSIGMHQLDY
jgi:hypothetical protein